MAHDVFISHSAKDKTTADAVCAMLESEGIRCWIAPRDVLPSMEWGEAIIDAIQECRIMVLVFTASANASPQIRREVERAVNHGVAILPLRVEDVLPAKALEYFIGNVHWLDALSAPFEAHLKNLAGTIKVVLARMEPRDAPPVLQKAAGEASRESEVPGQVATSETGLKPVESSSTETPATSAETTPRSVDISGPAETPTVEIGPPPSDAQPTSHEHRTEASDAGPRKPRIPRAWIFVILGGVVVLIASHHFVYWCWNHWVARNSDTQNYYYSIFGTADGRRLWAVGLMGEITESDDGGAT
ncbi:MAG: toll/interleukin-1 receptor domain-containing protein, partial [Terracidiphilus sp.]